MYTSLLFKKSMAYANKIANVTGDIIGNDVVYIVSALHELLEPSRVIAPYERKLGGKREREGWGRRVASRLADRHGVDGRLVVLAGADYADPIVVAARTLYGNRCVDRATDTYAWLGWRGTIEEPLARMQIGQRLRWLTEHAA
jgi:hypothetical protein